MTRPTEIRIDRLVLPASERHRAAAFRTALEHSLAGRLGGDAAPAPQSPLVERTASTVAARIVREQP